MNNPEEKIKNKFQDFTPNVNPEIWSNIESELNKNFEEKIQKKFDTFKVAASSAVWQNIESKLPNSFENTIKEKFEKTDVPVSGNNWDAIANRLANDSKFEKAIHNKVADVEFAVSPKVWRRIAASLNNNTWHNWRNAAAVFIFLFLFGSIQWLNTNPFNQLGNTTADRIQPKIETNKPNNALANNGPSNDAKSKNSNQSQSNKINKSNTSATSSFELSNNKVSNKSKRFNNNNKQQGLAFNSTGSNNNGIKSNTNNYFTSQNNKNLLNLQLTSTSENYIASAPSITLNKLINKKSIKSLKPIPYNIILDKDRIRGNNLLYTIGVSTFAGAFNTNFKLNSEDKQQVLVEKKADDNYSNFSNTLLSHKYHKGIKLNFGIDLGKNFSLTSGFGISKQTQIFSFSIANKETPTSSFKTLSYANNSSQLNSRSQAIESQFIGMIASFNPSDSIIAGDDYQFKNSFTTLSIPIGLEYTYKASDRINIGLNIGASLNIIANARAYQVNLDRNNIVAIDETQAHQYFKPYISSNTCLRMEYQLNKETSLSLGTYYQNALTSMNSNEHTYLIYPNQLGFELGIQKSIYK